MRKYTNKEVKIAEVVLIAASLILTAVVVYAQDTLVRDGATCDIPMGYNSAPYSEDFNVRGMDEFCAFPTLVWEIAIRELLEDYIPPDLPECESGLVFGPAIPVFPCYELVTE